MQSGCRYYQVIDVAIDFYASFCKDAGFFYYTMNRAKSIVVISSKKHNQVVFIIKALISVAAVSYNKKGGACKKNVIGTLTVQEGTVH